jgi:hypothetical protein
MGKCARQLVCRVSLLSTLNCLLSGTNPLPLATLLLLNTARRVQVFLKAWLSMLPPTAMRTTVPIVTTAVTPSPRTVKTPRCISSKVTRRTFKALIRTTRRTTVLDSRTFFKRTPQELLDDPSASTSSNDAPRRRIRHYSPCSSRRIVVAKNVNIPQLIACELMTLFTGGLLSLYRGHIRLSKHVFSILGVCIHTGWWWYLPINGVMNWSWGSNFLCHGESGGQSKAKELV